MRIWPSTLLTYIYIYTTIKHGGLSFFFKHQTWGPNHQLGLVNQQLGILQAKMGIISPMNDSLGVSEKCYTTTPGIIIIHYYGNLVLNQTLFHGFMAWHFYIFFYSKATSILILLIFQTVSPWISPTIWGSLYVIPFLGVHQFHKARRWWLQGGAPWLAKLINSNNWVYSRYLCGMGLINL